MKSFKTPMVTGASGLLSPVWAFPPPSFACAEVPPVPCLQVLCLQGWRETRHETEVSLTVVAFHGGLSHPLVVVDGRQDLRIRQREVRSLGTWSLNLNSECHWQV